MPGLPPLTELEVASGLMLGPASPSAPPLAPAAGGTPREALAEVLRPALERAPCLVAFSGGKDSSSILAGAVDIARREGLPLPVPVTLRYPRFPRTDETEWQESLIRHLGLDDWELVEVGDELEVIGPVAAATLRRHGLLWPPNAPAMVPMLERARGGSFVTGNGGDEVFSEWAFQRIRQILRRQVRPEREDLKWVALWFAPEPLRRLAWRRRPLIRLPWLTEEGNRLLAGALAHDAAPHTAGWAGQLEGVLASRFREVALAAFGAMARDHDVLLAEPYLDPRFVRAVAASAPYEGYGDRTAVLRHLFGDLLPEATVTRSTKAVFTEVFLGERTRAFARTWDGTGVPPLVDVERLRAAWSGERLDMRSLTLLQSAWLAADRRQAAPAVSSSSDPTTS